jgi:hypothetical protein
VTSLWEAPAAVAALIAWLLAPAQTIGQVAEREGFRRQFVGQSVGHYTNVSLPDAPVRSAIEGLSVAPASAANAAAATVYPRDEDFWRSRATNARAKLERDQLMADGFATRVSSLTREIVNTPEVTQQAKLRADLQKAMDELDRLEKVVLNSRRELETVQDEARRQGIPPSWLR